MTMHNGCPTGACAAPVAGGLWPAEARAGLALLEQCRALMADLPGDAYARPSSVLVGGTIGRHLRHLLDHYSALQGAFAPGAVIDYDHRERGQPVETSVLVGLAMVDRVARQLQQIAPDRLALTVRVRSMLDSSGTEVEHPSTLGRELAFATHHGLHHAAMIAAICREHGVAVSDEFGKAPSTLAYEARAGQGAR